MTAWLDIVKKHSKMNKGKSLKEFLPDAKKEYDMLKKSGKIQFKSTSSKKTKSFKKRGKSKKYTRKQRGRGLIRGSNDDVMVTGQDDVMVTGQDDDDDDNDDDNDDDKEEEEHGGGKKRSRKGGKRSRKGGKTSKKGGKRSRKGGKKSRRRSMKGGGSCDSAAPINESM